MLVKNSKRIGSKAFYKIKEYFSWMHREYPQLRGILPGCLEEGSL
jgi:hypothetical protein